jgi:hypothetical protein
MDGDQANWPGEGLRLQEFYERELSLERELFRSKGVIGGWACQLASSEDARQFASEIGRVERLGDVLKVKVPIGLLRVEKDLLADAARSEEMAKEGFQKRIAHFIVVGTPMDGHGPFLLPRDFLELPDISFDLAKSILVVRPGEGHPSRVFVGVRVFQNEGAARRSLGKGDAITEAPRELGEKVSAQALLRQRMVQLSTKHPYDGREGRFIELLVSTYGQNYTRNQVKRLLEDFRKLKKEGLDTEGFQFAPNYDMKQGPKPQPRANP